MYVQLLIFYEKKKKFVMGSNDFLLFFTILMVGKRQKI